MIEVIKLSFEVAIFSTALVFIIGILAAKLVLKSNFFVKNILNVLFLFPMVLPPTITGYLLLLIFGQASPLGFFLDKLGFKIIYSKPALILAAFVVSFPIMYQGSRAALLGIDHRIENAARTIAMSELKIFFKISLPLASSGIIATTALSFARAFGEFGATLIIAGNIKGYTSTIPLALYDSIMTGKNNEANIFLLISLLVSVLIVVLIGLMSKKANSGASHFG